jgi:hypothetical protein
MKHVSLRQALQNVADNPSIATDEIIQVPVHELVCRALFEIANSPDAGTRGAMTRANKARKMILDRLVGKRRAGSHPATRVQVPIEFVDLTGGGEING